MIRVRPKKYQKKKICFFGVFGEFQCWQVWFSCRIHDVKKKNKKKYIYIYHLHLVARPPKLFRPSSRNLLVNYHHMEVPGRDIRLFRLVGGSAR